MAQTEPTSDNELVPLADRLRYMSLLRIALAVTVVVIAASFPALRRDTAWHVLAISISYVGVTISTERLWQLTPRRGLWVFAFLLLLDGVFLAFGTYVTGGAASPVRYLILVHVAAVPLLASYRTGVKIALWHSLLLLTVYEAQGAGLLAAPVSRSGGVAYRQLVAFDVAVWFVTIATGSFSALNERELRRRRRDLEILAEMGHHLEDANDTYAVSAVLLASAIDAFGFPRGLLVDTTGEEHRILSSQGLTHDGPEVTETLGPLPVGSAIAVATERRQTLLLSHLDADQDPWAENVLPSAANLFVVPLVAEGRPIAVLLAENLDRRTAHAEQRVAAMLERFAGHAALALRNALLLQQTSRLASTDGLTAVANRRAFDTALERGIQRAEVTGAATSVVLVDVDHFKRLNDNYGHVTGDQVLKRIAGCLMACAREYDTVARYGGEEFAVVLPSCGPQAARAIAVRMLKAIASSSDELVVTASAGVATYPRDGTDTSILIRAADAALYRSKETGRNRVTSSTEMAVESTA